MRLFTASVEIRHSIQLAAKRSGLTTHVIRAWEKRYDAVSPGRTDSNRRLYSEEEIERLSLLGVLTNEGHRIGDIARLPTPTLAQMVSSVGRQVRPVARAVPTYSATEAIEKSLESVHRMDADTLGAMIERASIALGQRGFLERFVSPLARRIGELWEDGTMTAAHEHFASNVLRQSLLSGSRAFSAGVNAPLLVVTTPTGQLHELGAAIVAASARDIGWRVLYLGANLPAADIAHAAVQNAARAVALSIVYPGDDVSLPDELVLLRRLVPAGTDIIAGGAAAPAYRSVQVAAGMILLDNLDELSDRLTQLRLTPAVAPQS